MEYNVIVRMIVGGEERMNIEGFKDFDEAFRYVSDVTKAMNTIYMMDGFEVSIKGE